MSENPTPEPTPEPDPEVAPVAGNLDTTTVDVEPVAGNIDATTVDVTQAPGLLSEPDPDDDETDDDDPDDDDAEGTPEQTANGVKAEDGEQDVEQSPAPVEGSQSDEGAA